MCGLGVEKERYGESQKRGKGETKLYAHVLELYKDRKGLREGE